MAGFVQIIEIVTSRIDDFDTMLDRYRESAGASSTNRARRSTVTADRDRPNTYLNIVEFDSHEAAMENSKRPETAELAEQLAKLCDAPPKFYNLDVRRTTEF